MADKKINVDFKLRVDNSNFKSGIEEARSLLQQITNLSDSDFDWGVSKELTEAKRVAEELDRILEKSFNADLGTLNVTKFSQELKKSNLDIKSIQQKLLVTGDTGARAFNKLSKEILNTRVQIKQSSKLVDEMFTTFKNTIRYGISSSIFNNFSNSISKAYDYVRNLDSSLNDIRIVTGKSAAEMSNFAQSANEAAKSLGASTLDVTNASLIYYQQGLSDSEVQARAETTVKVANVTGQRAEEVSEQLTAVWNGYKVSASETEVYIDKLAAVAATTASDLEELSTAMSKVASAASAMGVDFDDLNAQISTIVSVTRQAPETVGTALKTIYARLGDLKVDGVDEFGVKLGEVTSQLQRMGIEILDENGNMRSMTTVMSEVAEKWKTWTDAQRQAAAIAMAGKRQYNNLIALFDNWGRYSEALNTSISAMGTLQKQQDIYMQSTQAKIEKLRASWQGLYQSLISSEAINFFIEATTNIVNVLNKFSENLGGGLRTFLALGFNIATIFDKQIASSINGVLNKTDLIRQNALVLSNMQQSVEAGPMGMENPTDEDLAFVEGLKEQQHVMGKVLPLARSMSEEQQNIVIETGKQLGQLKEEEELLTSIIKKTVERKNVEGDVSEYIERDASDILEESEKKALKVERAEEAEDFGSIINEYDQLEEALDGISEKAKGFAGKIRALLSETAGFSEKNIQEIKKLIDNKTLYEIVEKENLGEQIIRLMQPGNQMTTAKISKDQRIEMQKQVESFRHLLEFAKSLLEERKKLKAQEEKIKESLKGSLKEIEAIVKTTEAEGEEEEEVKEIIEGQGLTLENLLDNRETILKLLEKSKLKEEDILKLKKQIADLEEIAAARAQQQAIQSQQIALNSQIDTIIKVTEKAKKIEEVVALTTSSISLVTSFYAEVNSFIETITDDTITFTDKIMQLGTIVMVGFPKALKDISTYLKGFGVSVKLTEALEAKKSVNNIIAGLTGDGTEPLQKFLKQLNLGKKLTDENIASLQEFVTQGKLTQEQYNQLINANGKLSASILKTTTTMQTFSLFAMAIGVSIAVLVTEYKYYTQALDKAVSQILKSNKEKQEEIALNNELCNSYSELYKKYKEGNATKDEVAEAAQKVADKYDIEFTALERLTGQYDKFNERLKEAKGKELAEGFNSNLATLGAGGALSTKLSQSARKGLNAGITVGGKTLIGSILTNSGFDFFTQNGEAGMEELRGFELKIGGNFGNNGVYTAKNIDDPKEMIALYEQIQKDVKNSAATAKGRDKAEKWLAQMKEAYEEAKYVFDSIDQQQTEMQFNSYDFDNAITDVDQFNLQLLKLRHSLQAIYGDDAEKIDQVISDEFKNSTNAVVTFGMKLDDVRAALAEGFNFDRDDKKGIENWNNFLSQLSEKEQQVLADNTNNVVSKIKDLSEKGAISVVKATARQLDSQDLSSVSSLRDKIISGTKLTKAETEELLSQQADLIEDYEVKMASFEDKTRLEKVNILNNILAERIADNNEKIRRDIEANKALIEETEKSIEALEKKKTSIQNKGYTSQADLEEIAKIENEITEKEQQIIVYQNEINGKNYENEFFDQLLQSIDGAIDRITVLKDLASTIGEGWVVATDNIREFAQTFPTLFQAQENYQFLEDGSLQLTEAGQEELKNQIDLMKEQLEIQYEAQIQEIKRQEKIKLAEAQYYDDVAKNLRASLENKNKSYDLEGNLTKALEEYKVRLMEATGLSNETLNTMIQENSIKTTEVEENNVKQLFQDWQNLGSMIAAVDESRKTGVFNPPTWTETTTPKVTSVNVSSADKINSTDWTAFDFQGLSEEQTKELIDMFEQGREQSWTEYRMLQGEEIALQAEQNALMSSLNKIGQTKSSKDKQKEFDDEFDRYYDIKKAIEFVNNALEKLEKIQSKLHGKELIKSLENENRLIKQQAENYEELYKQQSAEVDELQKSLLLRGAEFDEAGHLTNYATLTASALTTLEQKTKEYNAKTLSEESYNTYEKEYESFKKQLERYNTLFYSEMKSTTDKLDEYRRQILENNLKIWETKVEIKLDTKKAERDWADFLKEINDDFRKIYKNLNIEMDHLLTKFETYNTMGTIETDLQAVKDVIFEINKLNSGEESTMFESISQAQEKLKELDSQLETDVKDMKSLWEEAWNTYIEGIDQAESKLGGLMEVFERINEELEFQGTLIELLYGEEAYDLLDKLYKSQEQTNRDQIAAVKNQVDMWHQLWVESGATLENQVDWTSDQQKYYEQWGEAQSNLNELTTQYIELLQKDYTNTITSILDKLERGIAGSKLEDIKTQWERITDYTGKYYDDIKHAYEVQKFANKIDQDIAKATSIKNQQKLQELREREITYLREKDTLTKYDLDAAEARYQIALKEIALEEAQQNKTAMKLVRNEQGNWSYQYIADADEVAQKQDDLLTSYGDLYKLASDAYQENLDSLQSLQETYLQSAAEIRQLDLTDHELAMKRKEELDTWYEEQYNLLAEENELYRQDLITSGAGLLLQVYQQDQTAYEYMTDVEQGMLDSLVNATITSYQDLQDRVNENYDNIQTKATEAMSYIRRDWTASAQQIADSWNADDGESVKSMVLAAHNSMTIAADEYQHRINDLADSVERDFGENGISGAIDKATKSTNTLSGAVKDLCISSQTYLGELKDAVDSIGTAFGDVITQATKAIKYIKTALALMGKDSNITADDYDPTNGGYKSGVGETGNNGSGSGSGARSSLPTSGYIIVGNDTQHGHPGSVIDTNFGSGYETEAAATKALVKYNDDERAGNLANLQVIDVKDLSDYQQFMNDLVYDYDYYNEKKAHGQQIAGGHGKLYYYDNGVYVEYKQKKISEESQKFFDTGGYTGSWGQDGRLAILHQKELVLNADDTSNFLSGVSMLRDMVSLNGSIEKSIVAAVGAMALQFSGLDTSGLGNIHSNTTTTGGDTYYVNAEFPNANDTEEIKQAILSLPNVVSQYIHQNV